MLKSFAPRVRLGGACSIRSRNKSALPSILRLKETYRSAFFLFHAEDGIRVFHVTGVQTCALPISLPSGVALSAYRASSVCASAPRCSAATWPPDRPPTAATWSRRRCHSATRRWSDRDHPPAARRRPVHGAAGLRRAAARAGGHGGGRRGH